MICLVAILPRFFFSPSVTGQDKRLGQGAQTLLEMEYRLTREFTHTGTARNLRKRKYRLTRHTSDLSEISRADLADLSAAIIKMKPLT